VVPAVSRRAVSPALVAAAAVEGAWIVFLAWLAWRS